MIISYSRNFIFIKTHKTAGTTVEAVLALGCNREDIIAKTDGDYYPGMDNIIPGRAGAGLGEIPKLARRHRDEFYNHMPASKIKSKVDPEFWERALKISVERHPYEKAVSQAYFRFDSDRRTESFDEFLDRIIRRGKFSSYEMWTIDGKVVVDDFLRQENLEADLRRVCAKLGIVVPDPLPRMKSKSRLDKRPASEILSDAQKKAIYETCRREFEILGYQP